MATLIDKLIQVILALVIVGTTLAFGGVEPAAYTLMEVGLFLALLLLLLSQTRQGKINLNLPLWPLLFAGVVLLQLVPLPLGMVRHLSPARLLDPTLPALSEAGHAWTTLSIYPHATQLMLAKFLAYLSAFVLAAALFDSRKHRSTLLRILIFIGCFEAAYGIFQYLTGWQKIFTVAKVFDVNEATGTYINRNHFAGLLELTLPFALASAFYSLQRWGELRRPGRSRRQAGGEVSAGYEALFFLFLLVVLVVAVLFSRSRAGILTTLFSLVFVAVLAQLKTGSKYWMPGVVFFFACVVGIGLWIGLNPVLSRFDQGSGPLRMEGRVPLWKDGLHQLQDYPLLGTGLGTFGIGYRRYQTSLVENYVDHVHNDFLEIAAETGLLGFASLFIPIFGLLLRLTVSFLSDTRRYRRSVTLGCIGSILALLIHSFADFNLQIPANALVFAVVLGIGYKIVFVERRREERVGERSEHVRVAAAQHVAA